MFQGKWRIGGGGLATTSPEKQNAGRMVVVDRPGIRYPVGSGVPKRDWSGNSFGRQIMPKRRGSVQTKSVDTPNTKGPTPRPGVFRQVLCRHAKVSGVHFPPKAIKWKDSHIFQAFRRIDSHFRNWVARPGIPRLFQRMPVRSTATAFLYQGGGAGTNTKVLKTA